MGLQPMSKLIRFKKFTPKTAFTLLVGIVLVAIAEPNPAEAYYIVALCAIGLGEFVRLWAAGHLHKNDELTVSGPYAFVKNPLYIGTFLISVGMCVLAARTPVGVIYIDYINWVLLGLFLLTFIAYYVPYKRKREGDRLRRIFGEAWDAYDQRVPDYLPKLVPYRPSDAPSVRWSWAAVCRNSEQWTAVAVTALVLAITFNEHLIPLFSGLY
jgi:protein-S-isoprenylcysteine O-methyltransferase Ste14